MTDMEKYIIARWLYSIGVEYITNAEYTILDSTMKQLYPDNEYCTRSWSSDPCPIDLLKMYNLTHYIKQIRLTDKTESIPSINTLGELEFVYNALTEEVTVSMKHDGWNIQADYVEGKLVWVQTRGRTGDAFETSHIRLIIPNTVPIKGKVKLIGELTVNNASFRFCEEMFGNVSQRNAVSTLLSKGAEFVDKLEVHFFKIESQDFKTTNHLKTLMQWGFKTPAYRTVDNFGDLWAALEELSTLAETYYQSPTDGAVVSGEFTRAVRLLHWEEPIYQSYILLNEPYTEDFGTQRISVTVRIFPIKMKNSTQRNINVTNLARILQNNLRPGYPIAFRIASSAIADLDEEATKLLQAKYAGKEADYRDMIEREEQAKCRYVR